MDELGGLHRALEIAKERAEIDAQEDISIEVHPRRPSVLEEWLQSSGLANVSEEERLRQQLAQVASILPPQLRSSIQLLLTSASAQDGAPLTLMPYSIHVH